MLNFKKVTLEDKPFAEKCMRAANMRGCEYTFANLCNWAEIYGIEIARFNDFLLMKNADNEYVFPVGGGDTEEALRLIESDAAERGNNFVIYGIAKENKDTVERVFPDRFDFTCDEGGADYIYSRESLATLAGKKLHAKRNHVNKFIASYPDWKYERLTAENLHEAREMTEEWCRTQGCESDGLKKESCAVKNAFENFFELGLIGALLRAEDRVVAYTMGSEITDDTFDVHIEKAFSDVEGAYTMINQQFVKNELSKYEYVNREEDMGEEGLRKAKRSYRPVMMFERYTATEKNDR